jgi:hypothetical protein
LASEEQQYAVALKAKWHLKVYVHRIYTKLAPYRHKIKDSSNTNRWVDLEV